MTKSTRTAIGNRIRFLREQNELTQTKFALMVNVERAYSEQSLEAGEPNVSIDVIERIAEGFGMSLSEFFEGI